MKFLLGLWQPKNKFYKFLKGIVKVIAICLLFGFLILPFICFDEAVQDIIKWIWLGCAVCNIDNLWDYKKFHKEKLITPLFSLFAILTLTYLYNYWNYLSLAIVICVSIVIGLLEFIVSIAVYKTIRLTEKMDGKQLPKGVIHGLVLGGLYICSLILFILGHFINQNMIFIFGGISLIMLSISVLICIGNGISFKKNIVSTVSFIIDVICLLALIVYLIYLIPNDENLQDIILNIVAAVVGGALTLAGVAWTIKKGEADKKNDLILQNKPIMYAHMMNGLDALKQTPIEMLFVDFRKIREIDSTKDEKNPGKVVAMDKRGTAKLESAKNSIPTVTLKSLVNTDNSIIIIKKIMINNRELIPLNNNVLAKNKAYNFILHIENLADTDKIKLYVEDVLKTSYCFLILPYIHKDKNGDMQHGIMRIEECKVENTNE